LFDLYDPAKGEVIGQVRLGGEVDAQRAIAAAKRALLAFSRTGKAERIRMLRNLHDAVSRRAGALQEAVTEEYGAPAADRARSDRDCKRHGLRPTSLCYFVKSRTR
jgi:aldehyde dehydrogenase (NAD+)